MTSNNMTTSPPNKALVPAPTLGKASPTKLSIHLDIRPTVLKPSDQDPMNILGAILRINQILDATNTAVEPTEEFNLIFYNNT